MIDTDANISKSDIEKGLQQVYWSARMEVLRMKDQIIIVDGAHNEFSARKLAEAIKEYKEGILQEYSSQVIIIFGVLDNHECKNILTELSCLDPLIVPVQSKHPKASEAEHIVTYANLLNINIMDIDNKITNIPNVMNYVTSNVDTKSIIVVTGSISVAAEALNWYKLVNKVNDV